MRRIFLLLVVALVAFVVVYRQRIFLWDPIATVTRDGVKQGDVRVMINYSNDVLVDDKSTDRRRTYLVQNWNKQPEFSSGPLRCIEYLACMTDGDRASGLKVVPGSSAHRAALDAASMTKKEVRFVDENGTMVVVNLR